MMLRVQSSPNRSWLWGRGWLVHSRSWAALGPDNLRAPNGLTHPAGGASVSRMCRNIRPLFNFQPPATDEEIRAAALQFVRKLSGFTKPSRANQAAFDRAVQDISVAARVLIDSMSTEALPKDREIEAQRARERSRLRFTKVEA